MLKIDFPFHGAVCIIVMVADRDGLTIEVSGTTRWMFRCPSTASCPAQRRAFMLRSSDSIAIPSMPTTRRAWRQRTQYQSLWDKTPANATVSIDDNIFLRDLCQKKPKDLFSNHCWQLKRLHDHLDEIHLQPTTGPGND